MPPAATTSPRPQQALNWIVKVYGSVDEIRRNGQIIIYMVHESIGHLGLFVSNIPFLLFSLIFFAQE
ncbi:MAG: DUF3141 domain-containing protein [Desulfobacteraceae bacterium]